MIIGMLTGAFIASLFFVLGYYTSYRLEKAKKQDIPIIEQSKVDEVLKNEKGFYSYKKYAG